MTTRRKRGIGALFGETEQRAAGEALTEIQMQHLARVRVAFGRLPPHLDVGEIRDGWPSASSSRHLSGIVRPAFAWLNEWSFFTGGKKPLKS